MTSHAELDEIRRTVPDIYKQAVDNVGSGQNELAWDALQDLANDLLDLGAAEESQETLRFLGELLPEDSVDLKRRAWLLNTEGNALSHQRRYEDAEQVYERMRVFGAELNDDDIIAIANQNLGNMASLQGRYDDALHFYATSTKLQLANRDYYGAIKNMFNLVILDTGRGDLERAMELLDNTELIVKSMRFTRDGIAAGVRNHLQFSAAFHRAEVAVAQKEFKQAEDCFGKALYYARRGGNVAAEAKSRQNLANVLVEQEKFGDALRQYRRALRAGENIRAADIQQDVLTAMALTFRAMKRPQDAAVSLDQARQIALSRGRVFKWAELTADTGAMRFKAGETDQAIKLINDALPVFRENGDSVWLERTLRNLLLMQRSLSDINGIARTAEELIDLIPESQGNNRAAILYQAGRFITEAGGNLEQTATFFHRAQDFQQASGVSEGAVAWDALQSAAHLREAGASEFSLAFYQNALDYYEQNDDIQNAFQVRNDHGLALADLHRFEEALDDFTSNLVVAENLENRAMGLQTRLNLGEVSRRIGYTDEALIHLRKAVDLAAQTGEVQDQVASLNLLGLCQTDAEDWNGAKDSFYTASQLARKNHMRSDKAMALRGLGLVEEHYKHHARAARLFRAAARIWRSESNSHEGEAQAHLVLSLARLNRGEKMTDELNILMQLAEQQRNHRVAAPVFIALAMDALREQDTDLAIDLSSTSILIHLMGAQGAEPGGWDALVDTILYLLRQIEQMLDDFEQQQFLNAVALKLDKTKDGFGAEFLKYVYELSTAHENDDTNKEA